MNKTIEREIMRAVIDVNEFVKNNIIIDKNIVMLLKIFNLSELVVKICAIVIQIRGVINIARWFGDR
jgi:hypothetical protein